MSQSRAFGDTRWMRFWYHVSTLFKQPPDVPRVQKLGCWNWVLFTETKIYVAIALVSPPLWVEINWHLRHMYWEAKRVAMLA